MTSIKFTKSNGMTLLSVILLLVASFQFQNCSQPLLSEKPVPPKSVSVKVYDYCPPSDSSLKEVFASNHSAFLFEGQFIPDWDRDGLSDSYELDIDTKTQFNIHVSTSDTNADDYSDLINIRMGFDKDNQFRLSTCDTGFNDIDFDGLTDCEEAAIKTDPLNPDTDSDGIPDGVELRNVLNPSDPADGSLDPDQDGFTNLIEVKLNSPLKQSNTVYSKDLYFGYELENIQKSATETCYNITVNNIPIMDVTNGNYIRLYFLETHLEVAGSQTVELSELQQLNLVIDRNVVGDSLIEVQKDNTVRKQLEIINIEAVQ